MFDTENFIEALLVEHLGESSSFALPPGYSDKLVAARLCNLYNRGKDAFLNASTVHDREKLAKVSQFLKQVGHEVRSCSLPTFNKVNRILQIETDTDEETRGFILTGLDARISAISDAINAVMNDLPNHSRERKVDWKSCAVAGCLRDVWQIRTGKPAPKSIHSDLLGPFGSLLHEVLECLGDEYPRIEPPVSARSALRGLEQITKQGIELPLNW